MYIIVIILILLLIIFVYRINEKFTQNLFYDELQGIIQNILKVKQLILYLVINLLVK